MYQAQMLQAQQAQAQAGVTPVDPTKKDGQPTPVAGQPVAYQYATNPYYMQQQQMLAAHQAQAGVAGQQTVTPQVAPVQAGFASATNATLPGQENWTTPV